MTLKTLITSSVLPEKKIPTAVAKATPDYGVIGSVVKLNGGLSSDPDGVSLSYTWSFISVPIGSNVESESFRVLDNDKSVVSFSPDIVGEYVVGLVVSNGMFESPQTRALISIRASLVPHAQGIIPDGKWVWSYIRDVWQGVDNKEMFETLWSALIQIAGSELLKLYQVDFNKSIRDIQDLFQRRWLSYEPRLQILENGPNFYIGKYYAGNDAFTIGPGTTGSIIVLTSNEVILVEGSLLPNVAGESLTITSSRNLENLGSYDVLGQNADKNGYRLNYLTSVPDPTADRIATNLKFNFTFQSTEWSLEGSVGKPFAESMMKSGSPLDYLLPLWMREEGSSLGDVEVGDVIHFKTGPNKGFYRILSQSGSFITVDKAPPSFSDSGSVYLADAYRPVEFTITQPDNLLTDTVLIPYDVSKDISKLSPGRMLIVNNQAFTVLRTSLDTKQKIPCVVVAVDRPLLQSGLQGLYWSTPPTMVSTVQDFDSEGVSPGDRIYFDVTQDGASTVSVPCQVVGVDRGRVGVAYTTDTVFAGQVPPVQSSIYALLAEGFNISGVRVTPAGAVQFTGDAEKYRASINSPAFKKKYWDVELTPNTDISVNPTYRVRPSYIVRTKRIPVDDSLRSVPMLQTQIVQPVVRTAQTPGYLLRENLDYIIDGEVAFEGTMTFKTGSDIIDVDNGDFVDLGIGPGDQFIIQSPVTLERSYYIQAVLSPTRLKLSRAVPEYSLSPYVAAKVKIARSSSGRFLRFVPEGFSASVPPPDRMWAEVSFFDNGENIENNFGILVGLTRDDIERVSTDLNYRQAVAGIMYAYLNGSAVEKIRIGAQILFGLPFAESRGIIRSIEADYRLDGAGNPILGRLLVEDIDATGTALGTLRIYTYPIEPLSTLAGLAVNPSTNLPYAVGDTVEKFSVLSKGVEVSDYVSTPLDLNSSSVQSLLQQYHSVRLKVNDSLFTLQEISLVSSFLKKITPAYIAFFITTVSEFADEATPIDVAYKTLRIGETGGLIDNASFGLPSALMLDSKTLSGVVQGQFDTGFVSVRRSGRNLTTTAGANTATVSTGGLVLPLATEQFEAPLTVPGDKLFVRAGKDFGVYNIVSVTDTTVTASTLPTGFLGDTGASYAILRRVDMEVRSGAATSISASPLIVFSSGGLRTDGVSVGDWLLDINATAGSKLRYVITEIVEGSLGVWNTVRVSPTPSVSGTGQFTVVRPKLLKSMPSFSITGAAGNKFTTATGSVALSLLQFGDELYVESGPLMGMSFMVIDPHNRYITPALVIGTTVDVKLRKKGRSDSAVCWDVVSLFDPIDEVNTAIVESGNLASCNNGSTAVTLQTQRTTAPSGLASALNPQSVFIRPGDLLKLEGSGNGVVDVGEGPGVYTVAEVTPTDVKLTVPLTATESVAWRIIRRR